MSENKAITIKSKQIETILTWAHGAFNSSARLQQQQVWGRGKGPESRPSHLLKTKLPKQNQYTTD